MAKAQEAFNVGGFEGIDVGEAVGRDMGADVAATFVSSFFGSIGGPALKDKIKEAIQRAMPDELETPAPTQAEKKAAVRAKADRDAAATGAGKTINKAMIGLDEEITDFMDGLEQEALDFSDVAKSSQDMQRQGFEAAKKAALDAANANMGRLQERAQELEGQIASSFRPQGEIASNLARIGGERGITVDRQIPKQQLEELKNIREQMRANTEAIKQMGGARWPS